MDKSCCIGIAEENQKHIFQKFYQVDQTRNSSGNGLGLTLMHRIVSLCNGDVYVESEQGNGSCFTVTLPR